MSVVLSAHMDIRSRLPAASALLAPYAVPVMGTLGRPIAETEDSLRFPFQRDRGRIVHTEAFRRLKGKTQVFFGGGGDHFRTRLTHTLEVAGISRDLARALRLNEDLAECIGLAHDLGHPPCGHAGESALDRWLKQFGGSFEHNLQSYRIVTVLERHTLSQPGLNLNREVTNGLLKHQSPHDHPSGHESAPLSWEAQVVNIADEITYAAHDCEDGLNGGLLKETELLGCTLARQACETAKKRGTSLRGSIIRVLTNDLYTQVENTIPNGTVAFSAGMQKEIDELHDFLMQHLYLHPVVLEKSSRGEEIIHALCTQYRANPEEKILNLMHLNTSTLEQAVVDYVSGMTDHYLVRQAVAVKAAQEKDLQLLDPN